MKKKLWTWINELFFNEETNDTDAIDDTEVSYIYFILKKVINVIDYSRVITTNYIIYLL